MSDYRLIKSSDERYLDQDGVTWSSPEMWFFIDILGGCGCGSSDEFAGQAIELLNHLAYPDRDYNKYREPFWELMLHWFDSKGLTEHGTVINGSWLTDEGIAVLNVLNATKLQPPDTIGNSDSTATP